MSEINIEVLPEENEPAETVSPVDAEEVAAIVVEAIEEAKQEEALEVAEDKLELLENLVRALDEKVQDLEEVVIDIENDIQEDEVRDVENDLEHAALQVEIQEVAAEESEPAETVETEEDVNPPHADQHILFAPAPTVWAKFKDWYNG